MNLYSSQPNRRVLPGIALAALVLAPAALFAGEEIDATLDMPADGLVQVENLAGRVELIAWDRSGAEVKGTAGDAVEEVIVRETSNGILVKIRNRKNERNIDGTEIFLRVPAGASLEGEGVSTDFVVRDLAGGNVTLNTVSGDLEIEANVERLELSSVSGDVDFAGSAQRSHAESVSGDVTLVDIGGEVKASTVSGDLSLESGELSRGQFETVSGEMNLAVSLADGGRLSCDSMSGDVTLKLPGDQQAAFNAQSFSGSISTDFGSAVSASRGPGSMLEEQVGDNGARIRVETFSGDVTIRAR